MKTKKKQIAIFGVKYFPSKGGTSRVVENLLKELHEQYDFTIYCYPHEQAANYIPGVRIIQIPSIPIKGIGVFIYFFLCCLHLLFKGHYDVIHVHKTDSAFFVPLLSLKYKTIATSHALPYLNEKWSALGKVYFQLAEWIFMHSGDRRTAVSSTQADYYRQRHQRPIDYIPNGILPGSVPGLAFAAPILQQHAVAGNYLFFAARRLIPLKGCHTLIDALHHINFQGTLLIAADIEQMPEYTKQIRDRAKGLDVRLIGYIGDQQVLNALISGAELFIFPSELEGMSMMLLETGSLGTPMICSDIPQNTAVFGSKEVLYFESKNSKDLAVKLRWAFANPAAMQQLAKQAKQTIDTQYRIAITARQYGALYDQLAAPLPSSTSIKQGA